MNDRYVETESAFADSYNQKNSGRLERLSVFPAVPTTSFKNAFKNDRITCINHNIISMEGRMTSIGSAIRNASSRSGSAVIMLLHIARSHGAAKLTGASHVVDECGIATMLDGYF